jgi:hypothetical protein
MDNASYQAFVATQQPLSWHLLVIRGVFVAWAYDVPEAYAAMPLTERVRTVRVSAAHTRFDVDGMEFVSTFTLPRPRDDGTVAVELERAELVAWTFSANDRAMNTSIRFDLSIDDALYAARQFAADHASRKGFSTFLDVLQRGAVHIDDSTLENGHQHAHSAPAPGA